MNLHSTKFRGIVALSLGLIGATVISSIAASQQKFEIKNVAEKRLK